jgi:hypothetical protein
MQTPRKISRNSATAATEMKFARWIRWTVLVLIVIAMVNTGACADTANEAPVITSVTATSANVGLGGTTTVACVATDPDEDTITYSWTVTDGTISGEGSTVTWIAPSVEGNFTISVAVDDGEGGADTGTVAVSVVVTTGSISVESNPSGAAIHLDGSDTGNITPHVITGIEPGTHTVRLTYSHYKDSEEWVVVADPHTAGLISSHYKDRQEQVRVSAGETTYVNWVLARAPAQAVPFVPVIDRSACSVAQYQYYYSGAEALEVAQILLDLGFSSTEMLLALRDCCGLDAYNAGLVLKDLGFNEYTIQSMLIELYDAYAVIVDVTSTINNNPAQGPPGYTGLAFCSGVTRSTAPYIPGLFGQFVTPSDINKGIGGDFRYVYVKYELVSKTSDQPVLTGIKAQHWPYWDVWCPACWTPVSQLTSGTKGSCDRIGMCARYEPFKDADKFITNVAISFGDFGNPASKCLAVGGSNANIWPLYTDTLDIHRGCEDEHWVFFCYDQAQAWPARPTTIEVSDSEKLALLEQYAPRVFFAHENPFVHPAERFYPCSVEWSFDHLIRYSPDDLPPSFVLPYFFYHLFPSPDNKYYVTPKELIDEPSDWLEYHYGCNGSATDNPCQLSDAPAYAFWNKQTIPWGGEEIEVVDLTYFFYFTYNRGKEYWWTVWGNHVGDWEHITVRLGWNYDPSTGWELKPLHLFVSAHDFGTSHPWDTISIVPGSDHPTVYSAEGSHGNYVTAGRQRYGKITEIWPYIFLADYTGQGAQWDTWTNLETFDYDGEYGLGSSVWPRWMSTDYAAPCAPDNPGCDPYDPSSGPIYRWGTYEFGSCDIECRMAKGPTGPVDKGMWNNPYVP